MSESAPNSLQDLGPFIYGTTRLGHEELALATRVEMARYAMDQGIWFHTSHQYGNALQVLRTAFDAERSKVPRLIFKIGWDNIEEVRQTVEQLTRQLALPHMDIGQLCLNGQLAEQFAAGGECCEELLRLKAEGQVGRYLLQVFPWTANVALAALRSGHAKGLIDGYIFYLNPLQRFASNDLWEMLQQRGEKIVSMRTVCGAHVRDLRDTPGAAWQPYLQRRAAEVVPVFEASGVSSWPEFCTRYTLNLPGVIATVGSTIQPERLDQLMATARPPVQPLPVETIRALGQLQSRWADSEDAHGEPGKM